MQFLSRAAIFLSFLFLPAQPVWAVTSFDVLINEIAWMGTEVSYNDEWVELYNNTNSIINLSSWVLKADDASPAINLKGSIPAKGFFLLERSDDNTVPDIPADLIYTGALNNSGEDLALYDENGNLIDEASFSSGWLAGSNTTKQTMERKDLKNWRNSTNPGGTPKTQNSSQIETSTTEYLIKAEPRASSSESQQVTQKGKIIYPLGIVFNEILPSPEGADADNEWIEIFNQNNFEVDLSSWEISDILGSVKTYTFPEGSKVQPQEYQVLLRPNTGITLNNDGDGLKLIQPDGNAVYSVNYDKAPKGQSYNRTPQNAGNPEWAWSINLTPGSKNIISGSSELPKEGAKLISETESATSEKGREESQDEKELAAISEPVSKEPFSLLLLLIALVLAIISGIIILFLKKRLKLS